MFCFLLSLLTLLLNVPVQADRNMFKPSSKVGSFMITPYLALNMFMFRVTIPYQTAETGERHVTQPKRNLAPPVTDFKGVAATWSSS